MVDVTAFSNFSVLDARDGPAQTSVFVATVQATHPTMMLRTTYEKLVTKMTHNGPKWSKNVRLCAKYQNDHD